MKVSSKTLNWPCEKCEKHACKNDSKEFSSTVNKGVEKLLAESIGPLECIYWYLLTSFMIISVILLTVYIVIEYEYHFESNSVPEASFLVNSMPSQVFGTDTDLCVGVSEIPNLSENTRNANRRLSKLISLEVGSTDVHYVFINDTSIPNWLSICSLESALEAIGEKSKVNVFLVHKTTELHEHRQLKRRSNQLSASLEKLATAYGEKLNIFNIDLDECLEYSPLTGLNLSKQPKLAKFAVELMLLWHYGGTVLDDGMVAVRGEIYRASGTAVEYGNREISSPVACHAFIFNVMLCIKDFILHDKIPFNLGMGKRVIEKTIQVFQHTNKDALSLNEQIVCKNGLVNNNCYYMETLGDRLYAHEFCPITSNTPLPKNHKIVPRVTA
ncbi:uncharacterized protein LOC126895957 isoform X2 [Daktulosphaira vitifoliae]|nr:uncharacterized protein LOC126895957 isoform X2 [Daktulosphaira vitifoliae]XP_050524275.1 uncharacterized protein LOC126895957 isoform X2 [Daktulosphaira vitifoliae]